MNYLFGYVIPYKNELKVREYDIFKSYYCGLCKTLGKDFNQTVRFGLNYDLTFLAVLLSSIDSNRDTFKREGCIANPFKKKMIMNTNHGLAYTSNISVMLIYFKLMDDWRDDKSLLSLLSTCAFLFPVRKAKRLYPEKYDAIKVYLQKLTELEKAKCNKIDESADMFAKLMEEIASAPFITDETTDRVLRWLGYNLGRWIYVLDAFNDIEEDIKKKNYNPILLQYDYNENESIEDFRQRVKEPIEFSLTFTLDNMAKSYELLDIKHNKGILDNIIYMGTRFKMEQILNKREVKELEKSI